MRHRLVHGLRGLGFVALLAMTACARATPSPTAAPTRPPATPTKAPPSPTPTMTPTKAPTPTPTQTPTPTPAPTRPPATPTKAPPKPAGPPAAPPTPVATPVAVSLPPDFGIQKSAQCDWAQAQCTFNILVTNYGPDTQMGISITDTMTISFALVGFGGPGGPICFMITPSIIRCNDRYPQSVPHNGTIGMGLVVQFPAVPLQPFQNCVYLLTSDANPQNNHACISIVPPMPTLPPPRTPPTP